MKDWLRYLQCKSVKCANLFLFLVGCNILILFYLILSNHDHQFYQPSNKQLSLTPIFEKCKHLTKVKTDGQARWHCGLPFRKWECCLRQVGRLLEFDEPWPKAMQVSRSPKNATANISAYIFWTIWTYRLGISAYIRVNVPGTCLCFPFPGIDRSNSLVLHHWLRLRDWC